MGNFGPNTLAPLPFKCRMLQDAAKDDVEVAASKAPKNGKYEVLFPIGMPDNGVFDWADDFLEKNPQYVELSKRKVIEWATKSGIWKKGSNKGSNDSPDMNFGIPLMD